MITVYRNINGNLKNVFVSDGNEMIKWLIYYYEILNNKNQIIQISRNILVH